MAAQEPPAVSSEAAQAPVRPVIRDIKIVVHDVFDTSIPEENKALFRAANNFHVETKHIVVRRELLFREGDAYDPRLLSETERNLRRLPIFRKVAVAAATAADGGVNVTVHAYDNWTITPTTSFKRAGGRYSWKVGLKDANLLGYGKTVGAVYGETFTQIEKNVFFEDPQFLGRRLAATWGVSTGGESQTYYASLAKPFYATVSQESMGVSGSYRDEKVRHEYAVINDGHVRQRTKEASVFYGRSLGSTPSLVRRGIFKAGYSRTRTEAVPGESVVPADGIQAATTLDAQFLSEQQAFVKEQNIRRLYRDEDINLGWTGSMTMGVSPRYFGSSSNSALQKAALGRGASFGPGHFIKGETGMQSTLSGESLTSVVWNVNVEYYKRVRNWSTLAAHASYDYGHQLSPPNALRLGELHGLRGYGLDTFSGSRRFLFNLEDRLFLMDNVFRLVTVGGVLFFDAGSAWMGEAAAFGSVKGSVGAGLRLGSSRGSGGSPLRVDLAYALSDNGLASRWSLSILTGQAF